MCHLRWFYLVFNFITVSQHMPGVFIWLLLLRKKHDMEIKTNIYSEETEGWDTSFFCWLQHWSQQDFSPQCCCTLQEPHLSLLPLKCLFLPDQQQIFSSFGAHLLKIIDMIWLVKRTNMVCAHIQNNHTNINSESIVNRCFHCFRRHASYLPSLIRCVI